MAKRQISLWSEHEKGAFVDAYKALPSSFLPTSLFMPPLLCCTSGSGGCMRMQGLTRRPAPHLVVECLRG